MFTSARLRSLPVTRVWDDPRLASLLVGVIVISLLIRYFVALEWTATELVRFVFGATALWGPLGVLFYALLQREIPDRVTRFTVSAVTSYALTALTYFMFAAVGIPVLFYVVQVILTLGLVARAVGQRKSFEDSWFKAVRRRPDWRLAFLIGVSLLVTLPYKTAYVTEPATGDREYVLFPDHLYHTGLAYELYRQVPPRQASIWGGGPERAYHLLPHLTTMLLARMTGQADMLRVHLVYHYTVIEILVVMALYGLGRALTRSTEGGQLAVAFMYILALPWPPILRSFRVPWDAILAWPPTSIMGDEYFFFTLFPHSTSGITPVATASPQMYSGVLIMFGLMLATTCLSIRSCHRLPVWTLLMAISFMFVATLRFRIHVFLAILPWYVALCAILAFKYRDVRPITFGVLTTLASLLLILEMRSDLYLGGSVGVHLGYSGVASHPLVNAWPLSELVHVWLSQMLPSPEAFMWVWQIVSVTSFVTLNVVGIPLFLASMMYLSRPVAWQQLGLLSSLMCSAVIVSTVGSMVLRAEYDSWSLSGQLLLHTRWYLYPLTAWCAFQVWKRLQILLTWPRRVWLAVPTALILAVAAMQLSLQDVDRAPRFPLGHAEQAALAFLREHSPPDSVIAENRWVDQYAFWVSGLAGRAAYLELPGNPVDSLASQVYPSQRRRERIRELWTVKTDAEFCDMLQPTPISHILEHADQPLQVHPSQCLRQLWRSPSGEVAIWQARR
jgi:hypothetical protein